ncbi:MAG TPA: hypothetical protein VF210_06740 [Pseudomonadales bacterium]
MGGRTRLDAALPYGAAALLLAVIALTALQQPDPEAGLVSATRLTARVGFVFFFVVFTSSVWFTWRATPLTRWLMRRRRHMGLSFALVHFAHLGVLSALFGVRGEVPDPVTLVGGGLAYLLLTLMVLTSNRFARLRLGRGWRALHLTGCWYIWLIFTNSYIGRLDPAAGAEPYGVFALLAALALAVPALRTWAWLRRRRQYRRWAAAEPAAS